MSTGQPEPVHYTGFQVLKLEEIRGWPHSPSPETIKQARDAHTAMNDEQQGTPLTVRDFQLADAFEELMQCWKFSHNATAAITALRSSFPDIPLHKHAFAIALTGASERTIGIANICDAPENINKLVPNFTGDPTGMRLVHIAQAIRDLQWLGFAPTIYPSFKDQSAFILCNESSGQPQAVVGLPHQSVLDNRIAQRQDFPEHPENTALRITLAWHGASVNWMPIPR